MKVGRNRKFDALFARQASVVGNDLTYEPVLDVEQDSLVVFAEIASLLEESCDLRVSAQFPTTPGEVEPDLKVAKILRRVPLQSIRILSPLVWRTAPIQELFVAEIWQKHLPPGELEE